MNRPPLPAGASYYEAGHVFGKTYSLPLPEEKALRDDLRQMVRLYRLLAFRDGSTSETDQPEKGAPGAQSGDATASPGWPSGGRSLGLLRHSMCWTACDATVVENTRDPAGLRSVAHAGERQGGS